MTGRITARRAPHHLGRFASDGRFKLGRISPKSIGPRFDHQGHGEPVPSLRANRLQRGRHQPRLGGEQVGEATHALHARIRLPTATAPPRTTLSPTITLPVRVSASAKRDTRGSRACRRRTRDRRVPPPRVRARRAIRGLAHLGSVGDAGARQVHALSRRGRFGLERDDPTLGRQSTRHPPSVPIRDAARSIMRTRISRRCSGSVVRGQTGGGIRGECRVERGIVRAAWRRTHPPRPLLLRHVSPRLRLDQVFNQFVLCANESGVRRWTPGMSAASCPLCQGTREPSCDVSQGRRSSNPTVVSSSVISIVIRETLKSVGRNLAHARGIGGIAEGYEQRPELQGRLSVPRRPGPRQVTRPFHADHRLQFRGLGSKPSCEKPPSKYSSTACAASLFAAGFLA